MPFSGWCFGDCAGLGAALLGRATGSIVGFRLLGESCDSSFLWGLAWIPQRRVSGKRRVESEIPSETLKERAPLGGAWGIARQSLARVTVAVVSLSAKGGNTESLEQNPVPSRA